MKILRAATRGSRLALAQSRMVAQALQAAGAVEKVELVVLRTTGDRIQHRPLVEVGGKGLFVKELEEALLDGRADFAIHSMKDVPAELPEGLSVRSILAREDPRDVLVCAEPLATWEALPRGAVVGTASLRRAAQFLHRRSDLRIVPLRGNVDTRLRKLRERHDGIEATVLAAAGLRRLGLSVPNACPLPPELFTPAVGQGILAVELRDADRATARALSVLCHDDTEAAAEAERAFLERLGGSCRVPMGAWARVSNGAVEITGFVADPSGTPMLRETERAVRAGAAQAGERVAEALLARGAGEILARCEADSGWTAGEGATGELRSGDSDGGGQRG